MFSGFFYHLRALGLKVSLTEWLTLVQALAGGHSKASLSAFYHLARALLIKRESQYDLYDRAFASYFEGVDLQFDLDEELLKWLENPVLPRELSAEERAALQALELDELRKRFLERLAEQKERHDGGSRWIGTGGTSPFGHGGTNPAGVRIGGAGGGRSAVQVASERRFRNLRNDRVLDTRQIGTALRRLRRLGREDGLLELDLDATVDKSAKNAGEIDLVFAPPRKNRVKLLLLIDVGGSMDPHADVCERLFSAAHAANHFRAFETRTFHNCPYERLYVDIFHGRAEPTAEVLKRLDRTWTVIFVGDAWMSPYELTHMGGAIDFFHENTTTGLTWLERFRERCPNSVWLNPEPRRIWNAPSVRIVRRLFPMFELTLEGLGQAVDVLCGRRPNQPAEGQAAVVN
ncbi:MAG: VWA domain-containing protein [Thermoanaerobaculia bacterium]|nr:VWA domain-containing protein [Thermoanaerobaculia bacterium]